MRQRPQPKPSQTTARFDEAARRRYKRPMNRLAEDLVNQLCVLNLIAAKIKNPMTDRSGVSSECDWQTFDGCIRDASLLGELMAQLLKPPADKAADDILPPLKPEGPVIRLLRMVPKPHR
jgi:hypothetical protein